MELQTANSKLTKRLTTCAALQAAAYFCSSAAGCKAKTATTAKAGLTNNYIIKSSAEIYLQLLPQVAQQHRGGDARALPYSRTTQLTCLSCDKASTRFLSTTAHHLHRQFAARLAKLQGGSGETRRCELSGTRCSRQAALAVLCFHQPSQQSKHALGARGLQCQQVASSVRAGPLHVRVAPAGASAYWHHSMQLLRA